MTNPPGSSLSPAPTSTQREGVISTLSKAFADDALTMDEFERRAEMVYSARTVVELQQLVVDLQPAQPVTVGPSGVSGAPVALGAFPETAVIRTVFGNTERGGSVQVPRTLRLRTLFGNTELNYSRAEFAPGVTEIDVRCTFGNIEITVPRGVRVEMACSAILASVVSHAVRYGEDAGDDGDPSQPVVRLIGRAVFASVEVHVVGRAGVAIDV